MGLKTRHRSGVVVQDAHDKIGTVVLGIHQGRHGGMKKSGISADRYNRLIKPELAKLAEATG
jgi:hypothetical protein